MLNCIQLWGCGLLDRIGLLRSSSRCIRADQNSLWSCFRGVTLLLSASSVTDRLQAFGFETMLNLGATGEVPMIRNNSTSRPKNRNLSSVISFSQSSVARCSSVKRSAIQQMVTAFNPAA